MRPLPSVPAWLNGQGGRPEGYCHRQLIDAVRYLVAEGVRWASLPAEFPKWRAVYRFFRRWRDNDFIKELYGRLRTMLRALAGKKQAPTAAIIDSQSVKADATVGAATRGYDAGKKINGRKRHIAVGTLGFSHLIRARRLARHYETCIDSAEAMAWWAASIPATRRLARSGRPTPRRLNWSAA